MAAFAPLSCPRGSQRTNEHRTFEDIKVGCAPRPSRRLSSVAARRASPLDSALRVARETTLGHRQLHPDVSHMRRVSPPRVSLYSILGCDLRIKKSPFRTRSQQQYACRSGAPRLARGRLTMQNRKYITRDHMNGAAAARDTDNELPPLARPPTPRGEWRQLIAHQRPTQHADPRCTLRPPGRGALSLFGPLASPGWIRRWPALGCAPAARRGGDLGG